MSENVAQSYNNANGVPKQAVRSGHKSVWISHWMSSTTTKQTLGRLSLGFDSPEEDNHDPKQLCLLEGPIKAQNVSEEENMIVKSEKVRSSFPMFSLPRKGANALTLKTEQPSSSHPVTGNYSKNSTAMDKWVSDSKNPSIENPTRAEYILGSTKEEVIVEEDKKLSLREEMNRSKSVLESRERVTNTASKKNFLSSICEDSVYNMFGRSQKPLGKHDDADMRILQPHFVAKQTESENLYRGTFSLSQGMNTEDSMEEPSGARKKFLLSRHFMFAKTEVNVIEEGPMLEDANVLAKLKGKYPSELFPFDQGRTFPIKTGLDLNLLGNSMDTKVTSETNTMDLDAFRKYHVSGVVASSSNKRFPMFQPQMNPSREIKQQIPRPILPDINRLPNDLTAHTNSDASTSRTQSLGTDHLPNIEEPQNLKRKTDNLDSEPSLWVKRLKLTSGSASGTQSSKMGDDSSHEKVNHIFQNIMKLGRPRGKDLMQLDVWKGEKPSIDSVRKNRDITLTHPWVQRLCKNSQSLKEKSTNSKSRLLKESMEKSQPEDYPSLAAMALMGRVMRGFDPCQLMKNGSTAFWNA